MSEEINSKTPELQVYLANLLDGTLTADGQAELAALLRDNPAAQDEYRRIMAVHALLHLDFSRSQLPLLPRVFPATSVALPAQINLENRDSSRQYSSEESISTKGVAPRSPAGWLGRKRESYAWRLAGAGSMVAASLIFMIWHLGIPFPGFRAQPVIAESKPAESPPKNVGQIPIAERRPVAVLSQASRAAWTDPRLPINSGGSLEAGKYDLKEGVVQLEFMSGASVIIEAPAQFELLSSNRISCALGKIRAHVPSPATGFTVETPNYDAVDIGTEFTVQIQSNGESQFQVIEGEVDLRGDHSDSLTQQKLLTGEGVRAAPDGKLRPLDTPKMSFVGTEQMLEMASVASQERYDAWKEFSQEIRRDPNLVFCYAFDDHHAWERVLHNAIADGKDPVDGAIVGCQWTTGRWEGKQALEFKRTTDRVRLNVPGEFDSLTYTAWFRIEGLERWLSSLMLTDGHQSGEVHWQMTDKGELMLGVKAEPNVSHDFYSPSVIGPKDLGRWVHLACVYNGQEGYVAHYFDGAEISRENVRIPTKLRIGPAEIGNWVPQDLRENRIRSLNGRIDEFMLFNDALTAAQIQAIYEAGKPQP